MVHADVFRPPEHSLMMLSVLIVGIVTVNMTVINISKSMYHSSFPFPFPFPFPFISTLQFLIDWLIDWLTHSLTHLSRDLVFNSSGCWPSPFSSPSSVCSPPRNEEQSSTFSSLSTYFCPSWMDTTLSGITIHSEESISKRQWSWQPPCYPVIHPIFGMS